MLLVEHGRIKALRPHVSEMYYPGCIKGRRGWRRVSYMYMVL